MIAFRSHVTAMLLASSITACAVAADDEIDTDETTETTSELSSSSWTGAQLVQQNLSYAPAMAMLDGFEYYVYGYEPGGKINPAAEVSHQLYWHQCSATACTSPKKISGQLSMGKVSLAAYNGFIYMVHQGDTDDKAIWFTHLDVTTGVWTPNIKLAFETFGGSPALAAFNNRLYMVGSREAEVTRYGNTVTTYPLWYTSMGTTEVWSPMTNIRSESASPPSIAPLGNTLYLAHRNGATGEIALQKMPIGGGWSAPALIPAGPSNTYIQGDDVQIAAVNGYLHLTHRRFNSDYTYWTYNRGCDAFAPEVSVDGFGSGYRISMSTGINGLLLNRMRNPYLGDIYSDLDWYKSRFIAPAAPMTLPQCGAF